MRARAPQATRPAGRPRPARAYPAAIPYSGGDITNSAAWSAPGTRKPSQSAVFAQIHPAGSRLTDLARRAAMTPQAMGQLVDELEKLGYVERRPDPADRRAKLIRLTAHGRACVAAGRATIAALEADITEILGDRGHRQLRSLLRRLLDAG